MSLKISVPHDVYKKIYERLSREADKIQFVHLTIPEKSRFYKIWTTDKYIVDLLSPFVPSERMHPYIKDSVLKIYAKSKKPKSDDILAMMGLSDIVKEEEYIKPIGVRLIDGRVICWGLARDWKNVLLSVYERARSGNKGYISCAAFLLNSGGVYNHKEFRSLVCEASEKLGILEVKYL